MAAASSAPSAELSLNIEKNADGAIIHCAGKITSSSNARLQDEVLPLIPNSKRLVLDLAQVNYLDSSGLGAVVRLWMSSKKANCDFKVSNLTPRIKDLFTLTNISTIFESVEHGGM
jgi:anti-sigma B factor antagonist